MCGFVGLVNAPGAVRELYDGLIAIQHRGQDAAGILTCDERGRMHIVKDAGLVRDVFRPEHVARLQGSMGIGHVRYPTVGLGAAEDAQPFVTNYPFGIGMVHNGNVTNYEDLVGELRTKDRWNIESGCDLEVILHVFAGALARRASDGFSVDAVFEAVGETFARVKGAYSVVGVIAGHGLFAFRDPFGIKPIVMGRKAAAGGNREASAGWAPQGAGDAWCIASESVVCDVLGFHELRDVAPGEAVFVALDGTLQSRKIAGTRHAPCVFEHVYFARPDSMLDNVSVYKTRRRLGEMLARRVQQEGWDVDVVIPVPESSCTAALSLAQSLGIPYREGFVKNRYIGRTFIMPGQEQRGNAVRHKLNAIGLEFDGKNVLIVDDSIVRGTTSKKIVQMAREAGAAKVYLASCSPPLRHPCVYGIDMSTRNEFIARGRGVAEINAELGCDGLVYQELDDLVAAVRAGNEKLTETCHACFSGAYPTGDVTSDMLVQIETERLTSQKA